MARGTGEAGTGAVPGGQGDAVGAEGHAAHHAVHAAALMLAAGSEVLTVLVEAAVELAGAPLSFSCGIRGMEGGALYSCSRRIRLHAARACYMFT